MFVLRNCGNLESQIYPRFSKPRVGSALHQTSTGLYLLNAGLQHKRSSNAQRSVDVRVSFLPLHGESSSRQRLRGLCAAEKSAILLADTSSLKLFRACKCTRVCTGADELFAEAVMFDCTIKTGDLKPTCLQPPVRQAACWWGRMNMWRRSGQRCRWGWRGGCSHLLFFPCSLKCWGASATFIVKTIYLFFFYQ